MTTALNHTVRFALTLGLFCVPPAFAQAPLHLASTPWSPFTGAPGQARFALDLVHATLGKAGIEADTAIVADGTLTASIARGEFDGSAALWKDAERERTILYSEPYLENRLVLVARAGTDVSATDLSALAGKRLALVEGFSYGEAVAATTGPSHLAVHSVEDSLHALLRGETDYALIDELVVQYMLGNFPDEARRRLVFGTRPLVVRPLHLGVRRDHPDADSIVRRFNAELRGMVADRSYHRLLHLEWIEADVDGDGLPEHVPHDNRIGPDPPERVYPLFATTRPAPLPASARRFYLDGTVYEGWANVPERYKVTRRGEAGVTAGGAPVFDFNWYVAEASARATITLDSLPFAVSFTDRARPVRRIVVSGVSLYDARALLTFALSRVRGRAGEVTADHTALMMRTVYHEDGYFLANVTAAPDELGDDLELRADEGRIGDMKVEGLRDKVSSQVARYFRHVSGERPVRRDEFERALMLSSDLSGVDVLSEFSIRGHTRAASLRLVGDEFRQMGSITFDTVPLAPGTSYRAYLLQQWNSLAVGGDTLRVMAFGTADRGEAASAVGSLYYRAPVGSRGTYAEVRGGNAFAYREFRDVNISSDLRGANGAVGIGHPLRRNVHEFLYAIGEYEIVEARSHLGAAPTARSRSQSGRLTLAYGYTASSGAVTQVSASVAAGYSPDQVVNEDGGTSSSFAHLRVGFGTLIPLGSRWVQRVEVFAQPLATALPVVEHMFLGYGPYLRSYPPVEFSGERGVKGTAELGYTVVGRRSAAFEAIPSVFVDFGYAANEHAQAPYQRRSVGIASAGVALRVKVPGAIAGAVWVGVPLADGPYTTQGRTRVGVQVTKGW